MNKKPLEGIKVLDLSQVLAAPFCGMMLADLGAQVIKVERPGNGDISREYGPYINGISLYYCQYNRGKKGLAVDLRTDEGKNIILDLVSKSDIVIENFKNGTLDKLGIGYDEMQKVNPDLIYGSISGFGTYGPLSHLPCMDIIAAARSGLIDQSGAEGEDPVKPGFSVCDTWAGLQLLRGLSMALLQRQRTKRGVRIDIAMLDCAFYMCEIPTLQHSATGKATEKTGNHDPFLAPYGEFAAKDGHVVIAVRNEEEWRKMCEALDLSSLLVNPRFYNNESRVYNRDFLVGEIESVTSKMKKHEIELKLSEYKVPAAAVQSIVEFVNDPNTQDLNVVTKIGQPNVGEYLALNTPIRFSKTPVDPNKEAPSLPGAHSTEILSDIGYSQTEIQELIDNAVID